MISPKQNKTTLQHFVTHTCLSTIQHLCSKQSNCYQLQTHINTKSGTFLSHGDTPSYHLSYYQWENYKIGSPKKRLLFGNLDLIPVEHPNWADPGGPVKISTSDSCSGWPVRDVGGMSSAKCDSNRLVNIVKQPGLFLVGGFNPSEKY